MAEPGASQQKSRKLLLINGPNLNLLGEREPERYGTTTLAEIVSRLTEEAKADNIELVAVQSNLEGELVNAIQQAKQEASFILINAGAFTHTSIAIRDALLAVEVPFIELHLSNIYARESFRKHSYLSDIAVGIICGFGDQSYSLALRAAVNFLNKNGDQ